MKILKIQFYKNPKRTKHRCSARFAASNSQQFTVDELDTAKRLIELAIKIREKK